MIKEIESYKVSSKRYFWTRLDRMSRVQRATLKEWSAGTTCYETMLELAAVAGEHKIFAFVKQDSRGRLQLVGCSKRPTKALTHDILMMSENFESDAACAYAQALAA